MNICVCISNSVYSNAHITPVRIYCGPYAHKFCAVDIFLNITHCQAKHLAKFHHLLGHGFTIQRVILIFIKFPSANQNQLFYMKYKIYKCKMFQSFQMHNLQIQVFNNTRPIKMFFNPIFHTDLVSQQTPMPKNK